MKTIKYIVPFQSIKGVNYEIDIWVENASEIAPADRIVLTGAENVFTTDENDSDNVFEPVRHQSGMLRLIDEDGSLMEELTPDNNLDKVVRLVKIEGSTRTTEWTGFLSCESYTDDYSYGVHVVELPVMSVLGAMDSIRVEYTENMGLISVKEMLGMALKLTTNKCGTQVYDRVYYSTEAKEILDKYIDINTMFTVNEQDSEGGRMYEVEGVSCQEVVRMICTFMGWTAREVGMNLYLERIGEQTGMSSVSYSSFILYGRRSIEYPMERKDMEDFTWRGDAHKRSIRKGAKSVEVVSSIKTHQFEFGFPETPEGDLHSYDNMFLLTNVYSELNGLLEFDNRVELQYFGLNYAMTKRTNSQNLYYIHSLVVNNVSQYPSIPYNDCIFALGLGIGNIFHTQWVNAGMPSNYQSLIYSDSINTIIPSGCYFCRAEFYDSERSYNTEDGILLQGYNRLATYTPTTTSIYANTANNYLLRLTTPLSCFENEGWININMNAKFMDPDGRYGEGYNNKLTFALKFGNKWWSAENGWTTNFSTFKVNFNEGTVETNKTEDIKTSEETGWFIPIIPNMSGQVSFYIYPEIEGGTSDVGVGRWNAFYAFVNNLSISHLFAYGSKYGNQTDNHYFRLLQTNFSDKAVIESPLASWLNEEVSHTIVMNGTNKPMKMMIYHRGDITEVKRPEKDLLDRMAKYYQKNRRIIDLEVEHESSLPLKVVFGIDGRRYLALSEERDWANDACRVRCFEWEFHN